MLLDHFSLNIVIDNLICNETTLEVFPAREISLCAQNVTKIWHMQTVQLRRIAKPTQVQA